MAVAAGSALAVAAVVAASADSFGEARLTCSFTDKVHNAIIYADCFG